MKSLLALHRAELGFQSSNVLVMKATGSRTLQENNTFFRETMSRIAALPGVVAVGATSIPARGTCPIRGRRMRISSIACRKSGIGRQGPFAYCNFVDAGHVCRAGHSPEERPRFQRGRRRGPAPGRHRQRGARARIAGRRRIRSAGRSSATFDRKGAMTIVGVVGDVRQRNPGIAPVPECYMPYTQHAYNNRTLQRRRANRRGSHGAGRNRAPPGRRGVSGSAGVVHDDGRDDGEERGRPEVPRVLFAALCREWPCVSRWRASTA